MPDRPPEPWNSFLRDVDEFVSEEIHLHLLGGFVVTVIYGAPRETSDLDVLTTVRLDPKLLEYAGQGSELHRKHGVYLDPVGVAPLPENYEDRLIPVFMGSYKNLRLFTLDPYDIALTKIERNTERDRDDVKHLAKAVPFDLKVLERRYDEELRVLLGNPEREDLTLKLWIDMINESQSMRS